MAKCRNDYCDEDAMLSNKQIRVSIDGDYVCDEHCNKRHLEQKDKFFNETVHNEQLFKDYILGTR